jgi:(R,R)-butanediol dehydrogenase / meso-butanediol dehydrogenase / diacetyl reductase
VQAAYYLGNKSFQVKEGEAILPQEGEVQLKVAYCGVCGTDVHIYHGAMDKRVQIPQVIGHEVSATVSAVGPGVSGIAVGDKVAVRPLQRGAVDSSDNEQHHIGKNLKFIGIDTAGGMQNYWNVPAYTLHKLPENLSLEHGALIEPLAVACHDVRLSQLKAGENAVVIGGGPIGMLVAMVAKHHGAQVLISEVNEHRLALARDMGFATINPAKEALEEKVPSFTAGAMADVAFEVSGSQAGVDAMTQVLRARGRAVMVAIHPQPRQVDLFRFFWRELQLIGVRVYEAEDFEEAIQLAAAGALDLEKLITQVSPLADVQKVFETIDSNPAGMKYLLQI